MAVIGQLSSVLAHEIKNPLEPIKGSAELLKIYYPEEEQILKICRNNTGRGTQADIFHR